MTLPARFGALVAGVLAIALPAPPAPAQTAGETVGETAAETGAQAFERRDFEAAATLWREEAAAGSARAKLGLGLISDLGLGAPRDPAQAMRWYLEAAEDGLPDAQFNVGVMLDSGAGVPRDRQAAAVWYGRAAANGHRRAQYNLGLLYDGGEGTPRNRDLARHWLGLAASELSAAAERLADLAPVPPDERAMTPPQPLTGAVVAQEVARRAELVWTAAPGPEGARFLVELVRLPETGETAGETLVSRWTEGSALALDLPADGSALVWRVARVDPDGARYAAATWRPLDGGAPSEQGAPPVGRVTFRVGAGDGAARRLAEELAADLSGAGLWTRIAPAEEAPSESAVSYAFAQDEELAVSLAEFLPVLEGSDAAQATDLGAAPGEVVVWLVGGLGPA